MLDIYELKVFLIAAGLSLSTIAFAIAMHNLVSAWFGFEEAFFFILGLLVAPAVLAAGLVGSLVIFIKGIFGSFNRGESR